MWEYCPRCCTTDEPEVIPVADVEIIIGDEEEECNQKQCFRIICQRCGWEGEYEE